jgi:glutamine amidotransferase
MSKIRSHRLESLIPDLEQPVLGICLGMQLMAAASEEDDAACLGIFPGKALKLAASPDAPVPNMGWCEISLVGNHALLEGIADGSWFYFVHSYALPVSGDTIGTAEHTSEFSAVMSRNNFHAAQFHPERSSVAGCRLLKNFLDLRQ